MYAGLTTADKPALEDAKAMGAESALLPSCSVIIRDIDAALAQIAEMEAAQKPLTWNERINQMTVEEKALFFVDRFDCATCSILEECKHDCNVMLERWLNSPYTE